jgi:hypothetical protein
VSSVVNWNFVVSLPVVLETIANVSNEEDVPELVTGPSSYVLVCFSRVVVDATDSGEIFVVLSGEGDEIMFVVVVEGVVGSELAVVSMIVVDVPTDVTAGFAGVVSATVVSTAVEVDCELLSATPTVVSMERVDDAGSIDIVVLTLVVSTSCSTVVDMSSVVVPPRLVAE